MKKIILLVALVLLASAASAADDFRVVSFQILKAAKQPLSFAGRTPAIYAMLYVAENNGEQTTFRNDSLQAVETAMGIKEALEEFTTLADYDIPVYNFYSFCKDTTCVNNLESITENDLLVIVKDVKIVAYQRAERIDENYFTVGIYASYTATFEVYDAVTREYSHKETLSDTLVWDKNTSDIEQTLSELPSLEEATQLAAVEIGKSYARRLSPFWITVQRFFFIPSNKDLQQAADYAENADWSEAMKIWEQYAGNSNRKTAAQSAFNMALACEINGNYELAMEWLQYAEKLYTIKEVNGYRAILQRRINESSTLEKQLQDL
jgi:hypothetical protein